MSSEQVVIVNENPNRVMEDTITTGQICSIPLITQALPKAVNHLVLNIILEIVGVFFYV